MIALQGLCQKDSILVARQDVINRLQQIQRLKVDSVENVQVKGQLSIALEVIESKNAVISEYEIRNGFKDQLLLNFTGQIKNYEKGIQEERALRVEADFKLRKQKNKTIIVGVLASVTTALLFVAVNK